MDYNFIKQEIPEAQQRRRSKRHDTHEKWSWPWLRHDFVIPAPKKRKTTKEKCVKMRKKKLSN